MMKISFKLLFMGTMWTIGAFGVATAIRFASNVILTRMLAPELFGLMLIVNTFRVGIELISDVGIGQNIVYSDHADDPEFYNTAWTIQIFRGITLWLIFTIAATPLSQFYKLPILYAVISVTGIGILLGGFTSVSRDLLKKRMLFARLNTFELSIAFISSAIAILLAYFNRTIWSLVIGGVIASAIVMAGSFFLPPKVHLRVHLSKKYTREIFHFGKWIFIASILYFLSMNFDRLYVAKMVPIKMLGVYGIARAMADLTGTLVQRIGSYVLFPFIASHIQTPRALLHEQLAPLRFRFLLLSASAFAIVIGTGDLLIKCIYDERYHAAAWMLPVLVSGSWFSIVANINELTFSGLGQPSYGAIANGVKFAFLLVGLPIVLPSHGVAGAVAIVALADLPRYVPLLIGQKRERFSFAGQDFLITAAMILTVIALEFLRWRVGWGTSLICCRCERVAR